MKSYTDIEQSKRLAKILSIESADSHYVRNTHDFMGNPVDGKWSHPKYGNPDSKYASYVVQNFSNYEIIPAWSLAALLGVLPSSIKDSIGMVYSLNMNKEYIEYSNPNISSLYSAYIHTCGNDNLVDACYEMISKLNELKML